MPEPSIFSVGCYNAGGIARGLTLGVAIADRIAGKDTPVLRDVMALPSAKRRHASIDWYKECPLMIPVDGISTGITMCNIAVICGTA